MDNKIKFKIEISPDNKMNAFGCYLSPSSTKGKALIKLNFEALLHCSVEENISFYEILSEVTLHELLHAIEDIFKKQFKEKEIHKITEKARKYINKE